MKEWNMANKPKGMHEDVYRELMAHTLWLSNPQHPLAVQLDINGNGLQGVTISGFDLRKAIFEHCVLSRTTFENCQLDFAVFNKCDLQEAVFDGSMSRAILIKCELMDADFTGVICSEPEPIQTIDIRWPSNFVDAKFNDHTSIKLYQEGMLTAKLATQESGEHLEDDEIPF